MAHLSYLTHRGSPGLDGVPVGMEHEQPVTACLNGRRIVALCSVAPAPCNHQRMSEATRAHRRASKNPNADWQVIDGEPKG